MRKSEIEMINPVEPFNFLPILYLYIISFYLRIIEKIKSKAFS